MISRVVLDASAAVRLVMGMDDGDIDATLRRAAIVIAPTLYVSEVANALRGYVRFGALDRAAAVTRYEESLALLDETVSDRELAVEALAEAARHDHPVYDLVYGVLARRTASALLTRDPRLSALASRLGIDLAPGS